MKAITFNEFGSSQVLNISEVAKPTPKSNELLIRVHAAALNRADILQRQGKYEPPTGESNILGLEIAGEIISVAKNNSKFTVGQRVFGLVAGGGYAQYCCLDQDMAMPIPNNWDYAKAAAIPEAFLTANETLFELGELKKNESVLIHAAGSGVGSTCVQMAKYVGAKVFFTAGTPEKIARVLALGADVGIHYKTQDFVKEIMHLTQHEGVDVIEDFIGGNYLLPNLRCLKTAGRLIIVAFMNGAKSEIDLSLVLKKRLQIKGSVLRTRSLVDKRLITSHFKSRWLPVLIAGEINPIIDSVYPMERVQEAHQHMENNLNFGKIVLTIS